MIRRKLLNNGNEHLPMSGIPLQGTTNLYNADEDRFSDANRPRDANGFKIIPGQQMNPLDFSRSMQGFYLNTMQEEFAVRNMELQDNSSHVFNTGHTLKKQVWPGFAKIGDFIDNNWNIYKNAAIEFTKGWTYLFSLRIAIMASTLATSDPVRFTVMPIDKYWDNGVHINDFIVVKSTTWMYPKRFVYDVWQWVANIKKGQKVVTYITTEKTWGFTASLISIITDIVKLS